MGSIPFLVLLGSFGAVLFWYAWRSETDQNATKGIFGLGRESRREDKEDSEELTPQERIRRLSRSKKR
ncbi:MAG: hypothetical protein AAGA69_02740 [Pseudomonadota bacterium]